MSNKQILQKAIQKAIDGGFNPGPGTLEHDLKTGKEKVFTPQELFTREMLHNLIFRHAIIFNHDFAKALWGEEEVDQYGQSMKYIRLWAKQVAVVHLGKKYAVENASMKLLSFAGNSMRDSKSQMPLVEPQITEYKLQDVMATIPFETHKLHDLEVITGTKSWQYHLQQMVISEDPVKYLGENI